MIVNLFRLKASLVKVKAPLRLHFLFNYGTRMKQLFVGKKLRKTTTGESTFNYGILFEISAFIL